MTDPPRGPRLVELVGLPGSGKTHVARMILAGLVERGAVAVPGSAAVAPEVPGVRRISRKLLLLGAHVARYPVGSARAAIEIAARSPDVGHAASRLVQWLVTQRLLERARAAGGLHVFEEGTLQALWSMGLRARPAAVPPLLRLLDDRRFSSAEPDLVVLVEAPVEVVRARLQARSSRHSRTQRLPEIAMEDELRRGEELLARMMGWWSARRGTEAVARVDNGGGALTGLEEVLDRIEPSNERASQPEGGRAAGGIRTGKRYRRSNG